jgi:hypothetical protein
MTAQAIIRSKSLMRRPLVRFRAIFDQVDAMTGEVMSALQNIDNQIAFIRKSRDDLWEHYMAWQDVLAEAKSLTIERSSAAEMLVRHVYQLLARRYPQETTWR